jgi:cell division initiation protein
VADEFDRLFKENVDMSEKLEQANERVRTYQSMEATLNNTLLSAQRSSEDIMNKAGLEADAMLRDAELKAKEIVHNALQKKQTVANELVRIKHAEEEFRARYKTLLESQLRDVGEIALPEDVNVLLDDSDGLIGTIDVRPSTAQLVASASARPPESVPPPVPAEAAPAEEATAAEQQAPVFDYAAEEDTFAMVASAPSSAPSASIQDTAKTPAIEPPPSGFVSSVSLGEVESPEMPEGPVELEEPTEFELPGYEQLGERERDTDIEEID